MKPSVCLVVGMAGISLPTGAVAQEQPVEAGRGATSPARGDQRDPRSYGIEDIVVTAQRRSERLQDVPVAISAASATKLASVGINSTQELTIVTPGLSVPQVAGYTQPHIRGIGTNANGPGIEQAIATYIDGVYIASAPSSLLTLNNIERIEVLKGPQGTLFGRNATGGLIQIVTKDPASQRSAAIDLTYANYQNVITNAYVSGPFTDTLKADIAARYETQKKGWGKNLGSGGNTGNLPHDFAGRIKFALEPTDATQIRIALDYEDRVSRRDVQKSDERQVSGTFNNPFFGGPFPPGGRHDINNDLDPQNELQASGISLQVVHDLGFASLQSITAYRKTDYNFLLDLDQTPLNLINLDASTLAKQLSQELQLSSGDSDRFTWTAGLYYFYSDERYDVLDINFGPSFVSPVPNAPVTFRTGDRMQTDSLAGFAQASYELLENTRLTLGGRYTYERRRFSGLSSFIVTGTVAATAPIPDPATNIPDSNRFRRFNYRIALDHKFDPDILGYVSYNTGFKSGGYNLALPTNPPFKPEEIQAWEVGLKSEFFGRHLRVNAAAYYFKYKNIQVGRYINNNQSLYNGAQADTYGVDLDADLRLKHYFSLSGGFAYNHARFKSFPDADYFIPACGLVPPPGGVISCAADGNRLPFAPSLTFNIGANYKLELPIGVLEANATYFRTSSYFAAPDNFARQPAYDLINTSISWTDPSSTIMIKVWGKNLANTYYATSMLEASQGVIRSNGAPRTYGVTASYKF